ncbi:MAG: CDGSH iron-sulfur domain-containing protein [Chloroflexota bacterium]
MTQENGRGRKITVTKNGPYQIEGAIPLAKQTIVADEAGASRDWQQGPPIEVTESYLLCRCGHSSHKPFCDKTHLKIRFEGTEVASREPYANNVDVIEGRRLT